MLSSAQIPYSMFNITAAYNNNAFNFYFPSGPSSTSYTTYNIIIPDGFYTISDLNSYMQQYAISNGLYLIDSGGNYVYYISVQYNATYYANQLIAKLVPTSLPTGYTDPSNWIGYPTVSRTPYLEILSSSNFGTYLGFSTGQYGINQTGGLFQIITAFNTVSYTGYTSGSITGGVLFITNGTSFYTSIDSGNTWVNKYTLPSEYRFLKLIQQAKLQSLATVTDTQVKLCFPRTYK
jgi:hypothetical protein